MNSFDSKDPSESIYYGVDFTSLLKEGETLTNGIVDISVLTGSDSDSLAMITTTPVIEDNILKQRVDAGIIGNTYKLTFQVNTSTTQVFTEIGSLLIQKIN